LSCESLIGTGRVPTVAVHREDDAVSASVGQAKQPFGTAITRKANGVQAAAKSIGAFTKDA
jgi:hypothetical protein